MSIKILFLSAVAIATLGMAAPSRAEARIWTAYPASMCSLETDFSGDYVLDGFGGVANASGGLGGRARKLHCPIVSTFSYRQEDIVAIEVYYDDRNSGIDEDIKVQVCSQSLASVPPCSRPKVSQIEGRSQVNVNATDDAIVKLQRDAGGFFSAGF